jgi:succinate dehydrogenase / fumarate reductase, cytochrome b subunit
LLFLQVQHGFFVQIAWTSNRLVIQQGNKLHRSCFQKETKMADVNRGSRATNRPLSPHLSIYRMQLPMVTSILVRITGCGLIVASLLVIWWFVAAASGPAAFARANWMLTSWLGKLVLLGSILALWYHLLGGLRHLIWDSGRMLDVQRSEYFGIFMLVGSVVLTVLTVLLV